MKEVLQNQMEMVSNCIWTVNNFHFKAYFNSWNTQWYWAKSLYVQTKYVCCVYMCGAGDLAQGHIQAKLTFYYH